MIKNVGKRLAASVCAFVSAIGISEAFDRSVYSAPILVCSAGHIEVKDDVKKVVNKISVLACDDNGCGVVCAVDGDYGGEFGCLLSVNNKTVGEVKYFNFRIYVNKCKNADGDLDNYELAMDFDIHLSYIVERLGLKEADVIGGALRGFLGSGNGEKLIRFRLAKLILEDVLGIKTDEGFYLEATADVPGKSNKYTLGSIMNKNSHPGYEGCFWRYLKRELYDKKKDVLVSPVQENGYAGYYGGVDQKGIWKLFFGTPEKPKRTNYYKTMTNAPLSGGTKTAIAIPALLASFGAAYICVKQGVIDPMDNKVVDNYVLSLKDQIDELMPRARMAELYGKFCQGSRFGKEMTDKVNRAMNVAISGRNRARSVPRGHRNSSSLGNSGIRNGGNKRSRSRYFN